jgi:hypothetical protein
MQSIVKGYAATGQAAQAVMFASVYIILSPILENMAKEIDLFGGDDDDDRDYIERVMNRWYNDIISTTGTSVVPIIGLGGNASLALAKGVEKSLGSDDSEGIFKSYPMNAPLFQYVNSANALIENAPSAIGGEKEAALKVLQQMMTMTVGQKKITKRIIESLED